MEHRERAWTGGFHAALVCRSGEEAVSRPWKVQRGSPKGRGRASAPSSWTMLHSQRRLCGSARRRITLRLFRGAWVSAAQAAVKCSNARESALRLHSLFSLSTPTQAMLERSSARRKMLDGPISDHFLRDGQTDSKAHVGQLAEVNMFRDWSDIA